MTIVWHKSSVSPSPLVPHQGYQFYPMRRIWGKISQKKTGGKNRPVSEQNKGKRGKKRRTEGKNKGKKMKKKGKGGIKGGNKVGIWKNRRNEDPG